MNISTFFTYEFISSDIHHCQQIPSKTVRHVRKAAWHPSWCTYKLRCILCDTHKHRYNTGNRCGFALRVLDRTGAKMLWYQRLSFDGQTGSWWTAGCGEEEWIPGFGAVSSSNLKKHLYGAVTPKSYLLEETESVNRTANWGHVMNSGFKCTYVTLKQKIPRVFRLGIFFSTLIYVECQVLQNKSKHLRLDRQHERIWFQLGCFLDRTARSSSNVIDNCYIQFAGPSGRAV
jgi:hypothetical protein